MNVARLKKITEAADPVRSVQARRMGPEDTVGGWGYFRRNFLRYFRQLRKVAPSEWASVRTPFAIFGSGNGKLPFKTFSTTPGADCPGAGNVGGSGKRRDGVTRSKHGDTQRHFLASSCDRCSCDRLKLGQLSRMSSGSSGLMQSCAFMWMGTSGMSNSLNFG